MFIDFFYILKDAGIPVSPSSFLTLHKALALNLINNLDEFYIASRAVLIKSERYFDIFDQVFAHYFEGANLPDFSSFEINEAMRILLEDWLNKNPKELALSLGIKESELPPPHNTTQKSIPLIRSPPDNDRNPEHQEE